MSGNILIYGANGFVGRIIARMAVERGLSPVLAGRDEAAVGQLAGDLDLEYVAFALEDGEALDAALTGMSAALHCAGPFVHTYKPMIAACLRNEVHYLDITGEGPVFQRIVRYDGEAKESGIMLMPGAGFDVAVTDCLAVHLQRRLPSATKLSLAFHSTGPAGFPPGTINTMLELIPQGDWLRRDGRLESAPRREQVRRIDFGRGAVDATMVTWGDVFTAYHSTGIPNIKNYAVLPMAMRHGLRAIRFARPVFSTTKVRKLLRGKIKSGSTAEERAASKTHVWGEVTDEQGGQAVSRIHGPDAGVTWTAIVALDVVARIIDGDLKPGYQTPGSAYGAGLVLNFGGTTWEDVA